MWLILGAGKGNFLKDAYGDITDINIMPCVRKCMLVYIIYNQYIIMW